MQRPFHMPQYIYGKLFKVSFSNTTVYIAGVFFRLGQSGNDCPSISHKKREGDEKSTGHQLQIIEHPWYHTIFVGQ